MQIFVKTASDVEEWAIVELQGELKFDEDQGASVRAFIGDLHYNKQGKPVMMIGHHMLHGEQLVMDKPIAILERRRSCELSEGQDQEDHKTREFYVKAIVKKKLLFRDRPKPIVISTPKVVNS